MLQETQYILMPASVIGMLKAEMIKIGIPPEKTKMTLIKLGFLIAQESSRGEGRAKTFDNFKIDLEGKIKSEGLGQLNSIKTTKGGDIVIVIERCVESTVHKRMKLKSRCNYTTGYLMGLVNAYIPTKRQYICKEIACSTDGTAKHCIFELKPKGKL